VAFPISATLIAAGANRDAGDYLGTCPNEEKPAKTLGNLQVANRF
jgi:hypothetical protein